MEQEEESHEFPTISAKALALGESSQWAAQVAVHREQVEKADVVCIEGLLSTDECQYYREATEELGYTAVGHEYPQDYRNNERVVVRCDALAQQLWRKIVRVLREEDVRTVSAGGEWRPVSVNPVFRFSRYLKHHSFGRHRDGPFIEHDNKASLMTLLVYLNDGECDFQGGATHFFSEDDESGDKRAKAAKHSKETTEGESGDQCQEDMKQAAARVGGQAASACVSITPRTGMALVFAHSLLHAGKPVISGAKYIMRTDVMFERVSSANEASEPKEIAAMRQQAMQLMQQSRESEQAGDAEKATVHYCQALEIMASRSALYQQINCRVLDYSTIGTLQSLPVELLYTICLFLPAESICSLLRCNRTLNTLLKSSRVWEQVFFTRFGSTRYIEEASGGDEELAAELHLLEHAQLGSLFPSLDWRLKYRCHASSQGQDCVVVCGAVRIGVAFEDLCIAGFSLFHYRGYGHGFYDLCSVGHTYYQGDSSVFKSTFVASPNHDREGKDSIRRRRAPRARHSELARSVHNFRKGSRLSAVSGEKALSIEPRHALLVAPPTMPIDQLELFVDVAQRNLSVLGVVNEASCIVCAGCSLRSALVVSLGHRHSYAAVVIQGVLQSFAALPINGRDLNALLRGSYEDDDIALPPDFLHVHRAKLQATEDGVAPSHAAAIANPDCYAITESLFTGRLPKHDSHFDRYDSDDGHEEEEEEEAAMEGVAAVCARLLLEREPAERAALASAVVLAGGGAELRGLAHRLSLDLGEAVQLPVMVQRLGLHEARVLPARIAACIPVDQPWIPRSLLYLYSSSQLSDLPGFDGSVFTW